MIYNTHGNKDGRTVAETGIDKVVSDGDGSNGKRLMTDGGRDIITPDDDEREGWNEYGRPDMREQRLKQLQERADDAGDDLLTADDIKNGENLWLPGRTYPVPAIGASFYPADPNDDTDLDAVAEMHVADPGYTHLDEVDRCEACSDLTAGEMCSCDTDGDDDDDRGRLMTDGGDPIDDDENRLVPDGGETATCPDCDTATEWVPHPDKAAIQAFCDGCAADSAVAAAMDDVHCDNDVWGGSKPNDDDDRARLMTDGGETIDDDEFDVQGRAEDADGDDSQMRIDDFGGRRILTDGGYESDHEAVQDGIDKIDENGGADTTTQDDVTPITGTPSDWRENVPPSMQAIDRWLMWSGEPDTPRRPHWRGDYSVSYNDPDDWHTFEEAVEAAAEQESWGIGLVTGDDVAVIDLDGVSDEDGSPVDWAPGLGRLRRAYDDDGGPYVEWSPSETGLHIPVEGMEKPDWWTDLSVDDREHEGVDLLQGQFVTVTGQTERSFDGTVIHQCEAVGFLLDEAKENIESLNGGSELGDTGDGGWTPDDEWLSEDDIRDALTHINADCGYPKWRNIGFAVTEYFHRDEDTSDEARERAKDLFLEWSETADEKWDASAEQQAERIIDDSWNRIDDYNEGDAVSPVSVGTLLAYAQEAGWDMPAPPQTLDDETDTDWDAIEEERQSVAWSVGSDDLVKARDDVVGWAWSRDDDGNKEEITGLTVAEPVDAVDSVYCSVDLVTAKREHNADAEMTTHLKMPHRVERRVVNAEPLHKLSHRLDALYEDCLNAEARSVAVQRLLQALEVITVGGQDDKTLYVYDPGTGIYDNGGREVVRAVVESVCPARATDHEKREIVSKIADRTRETESEAFEPRGEFGKERHDYRVVGNGILRLPTAQSDGSVCDPALLDYSPELRARKRVPTEYNPDIDTSVVSEWLDGMTGRNEDRLAIEELVGNVLLPNYRHPKITMLYGSGRNGKGVLLDVMAEMCGGVESTNVAGNSLEELVENNFRGLKMKNALVNLDGELNGRKLSESEASKLKALTGEEPQEGEDKQITAETFRNTAKLFHASNSPLLPPETQESWQERWVPIELPFSFVSNPDPNDESQKPDDKKIKQKMTREENLEAMLFLAVEGLARLEEQGDVSLPESPEDRLKNYALDADPISRVEVDLLDAARNPETKAEKYVPKAAVYDGYKAMARGDGVEPIDKNRFFSILEDRMENLPYHESRPQAPDGVDNNRERCLRGVRFGDDAAEHLSDYWLSHPWVQVTETVEDRYGAGDGGESLGDEREELSIEDILSIPRGLLDTGKRVDVIDAALVEWTVKPDAQVYAFGTATNVESEDVMPLVAFDCPVGGDDIGSDTPCYVEVRGAVLDEYDGELQLQMDDETSVHIVERSDDDQDTMGDATDAVKAADEDSNEAVSTTSASEASQDAQEAGTVVADGGECDTESIDETVMQVAQRSDSMGAIAGRVSATVKTDNLEQIKARIEKLAQRGDIVLEGMTFGGDPEPPEDNMHANHVQCRECGKWWPYVATNGHFDGVRDECGCGAVVDVDWNVEERSLDPEHVPDENGGE